MGLGGKYVDVNLIHNETKQTIPVATFGPNSIYTHSFLFRTIAAICTAYVYSSRRFSSGQPDLLLLRVRRCDDPVYLTCPYVITHIIRTSMMMNLNTLYYCTSNVDGIVFSIRCVLQEVMNNIFFSAVS